MASHTGLLFYTAAAGLALGPAFSLPIWVTFLPLLSPLNGPSWKLAAVKRTPETRIPSPYACPYDPEGTSRAAEQPKTVDYGSNRTGCLTAGEASPNVNKQIESTQKESGNGRGKRWGLLRQVRGQGLRGSFQPADPTLRDVTYLVVTRAGSSWFSSLCTAATEQDMAPTALKRVR